MSRDELDLSLEPDGDENETLKLQGEEDVSLQTEGEVNALESLPEEGEQPTAGDVLFDGLATSSEDAGDFLGLDTELHFSTEGGQGGTLDTGFGVTGTPMDLESAPGTLTTPGAMGAEGEEDLFPDGEYDEEFDEEDEDGYEVESAGPHKGVLVLAAFAIGALVVTGAVFGPGLLEKAGIAPGENVADCGGDSGATGRDPQAGAQTGATQTTPEGTPVADSGAGVQDSAGAAASGAQPAADPGAVVEGPDPLFASADGVVVPPVKNGERGSLERLFSSGTFDLVPRVPTGPGHVGPSEFTPGPGELAGGGETFSGEGGVSGSGGTGLSFPQDGAVESTESQAALFSSGLGWADRGDVDVVWRRSEVPLDALDAPTRVATPRVGTVRVHLIEGDFFEGKLIAMGEGSVWIETAPGRMAFKGDKIASIEALGLELEATDPGSVNAPKRGERVRIHAPGGVIYGHVVSRSEDGTVTLRTAEGGKVTIASAEVEAIGNSRAVIIQD